MKEQKNSVYTYTENKIPTPYIQSIVLSENEKRENTTNLHTIIFFIKGACSFTSDHYSFEKIKEGHAIFLPLNTQYQFKTLESSKILLFQGNFFQEQTDMHYLEELQKIYLSDEKQHILPIKPLLLEYFKLVEYYLEYNFNDIQLFELKICELQLLLSYFYTPAELASFFCSLLESDFAFTTSILKNWRRVNNIQELADLTYHCETGFRKKFRQIFGTSPYKWLQQKRSAHLYHEIMNSTKPLKVIAEEYGFKSLPHFYEYCHRYFHCTPGYLRKNNFFTPT